MVQTNIDWQKHVAHEIREVVKEISVYQVLFNSLDDSLSKMINTLFSGWWALLLNNDISETNKVWKCKPNVKILQTIKFCKGITLVFSFLFLFS